MKTVFNNCESHKMGATKILNECVRDGLSGDILVSSRCNLAILVLFYACSAGFQNITTYGEIFFTFISKV